MMSTVLLPQWPTPPSGSGVIFKLYSNPQGSIPVPASWRIAIPDDVDDLEKVEAFAYPTPWAWALMTSAVIREQKWSHLLFRRYQILLQALTLGYLDLEIVDLKALELGRLLVQVDDRFRYLGLLRGGASLQKEQLRGVVWGATSPETLVWPTPRRTPAEWQSLFDEVKPHERKALQPWADLRALLRDGGQWDPERVPWMKAVDYMVESLQLPPSDRYQVYYVHCRTVGPVRALFPDGSSRPLYLPIYTPDFAKDFLRALTGTFRPEAEAVIIRDSRNQPAYTIAMPRVIVGGDLQAAGGGVVRPVGGMVQPYFETSRIRLQDDSQGQGYFSALQPLYEELSRTSDALAEAVQRYPYFYPDAVRVVVHRLGEAGIPKASVVFSPRSFEILFEQDIASLPRLRDLDTPSPNYFVYRAAETAFVFLEHYENVDFGDLRALGWVLWQFFIGEAYLDRSGLQDSRTAEPLMDGLYAKSDVYRQVFSDEGRARCRRLATLQRFVKAYQGGSRPEEELCRRAVEAFARWVWGQDVIPNGPQRPRVHEVRIGPGSFRLARDES